jgi:hypothetical protein
MEIEQTMAPGLPSRCERAAAQHRNGGCDKRGLDRHQGDLPAGHPAVQTVALRAT